MQNKGFSTFSWALALLCLPSALYPLALLVSPQFSDHPNLTASQIDWFSIAFWIYPAVLLLIAGLLYKLHRQQPTTARLLLVLAFAAFYGVLFYIVRSV